MTPTIEVMPQPLVPADPMSIIAQAVERGFDAEQLSKLMDLQERWTRTQAKDAFCKAMSACQAEMPTVVKDAVNNHTNSPYARLETVIASIRPVYTRHGFSISFGEADCPLPNHYRIIATVRHRDGHSEEYHGDYPLDGQGSAGGKSGMNAIQAKGSSNSYGRKYMHFMIFNLALANEDNDGAGALDTLTGDEMVQVRDLIDAKGVDVDKFMAWAKVKTVGDILRKDLPKVLDVLKRKTGGAK